MIWGIDLGGTKIELAVLDETRDFEQVFRERIPTEQDRGYEHILSRIASQVRNAESSLNVERPSLIGVGTPGAIDPFSGRLKNSNTAALRGREFQRDLESELETKLVCMNDANCFALAEARLGAAKGAEVVFGVILGTGVGGAIVVGGKPIVGLHGIAGEWGHNTYDPSGPECYCGNRGCLETFICGPALEREYERHSGRQLTMQQIAEAAESGHDVVASNTVERLVKIFGESLSQVINLLDPEIVVVGGGLGNIKQIYRGVLPYLESQVFNSEVRTKIVPPMLGDSAGSIGAALLTLKK